MDDISTALSQVGMTGTESVIYAAGLSHGPLTVQEIVKATSIKRPTVYHALGTLAAKGLVSERAGMKKGVYVMSAPGTIRGILAAQRDTLDARLHTFDSLIPLLEKMAAKEGSAQTHIAQHDGIDGMKAVLDVAFRCKSKRWDIIAPYKNFLREYDADYAKRYLRARKFYGITSRTLWEDGMREGKRLSVEEIRERNPRLMPWAMHGKFRSMLILFDDKVAIFSSFEMHSATLITSKELHGMFSAMFEALWEFSEAY